MDCKEICCRLATIQNQLSALTGLLYTIVDQRERQDAGARDSAPSIKPPPVRLQATESCVEVPQKMLDPETPNGAGSPVYPTPATIKPARVDGSGIQPNPQKRTRLLGLSPVSGVPIKSRSVPEAAGSPSTPTPGAAIPREKTYEISSKWPKTAIWSDLPPETFVVPAVSSVADLWELWKKGTDSLPCIEWLDTVYTRSGWCKSSGDKRCLLQQKWIIRAIEMSIVRGAPLQEVLENAQRRLDTTFKSMNKLSQYCQVCVNTDNAAFSAT